MSRKPKPIFLERQTYRRRRLADAARMLPVLGGVLLALPVLWGGVDGKSMLTSHVMFYVFLCWAVLAVLAAIISAHLKPGEESADPGKDE